MVLKDYAANILPMLRVHKDYEFESLAVTASKEEHIAEMFSQDQKFCVGGVNGMVLEEYAVFVFLKKKKTGEVPGSLLLSVDGDELWRKIQEELKKENTAICIEEVENLTLRKYAVNILPAFKTKEKMGKFVLVAGKEDQVSEVLAEEYKGFSFEGIKEFGLFGSAVNLLPKMRIGEDCEVEKYGLDAAEERHVSHVLEKEDRSIATGRVKNS